MKLSLKYVIKHLPLQYIEKRTNHVKLTQESLELYNYNCRQSQICNREIAFEIMHHLYFYLHIFSSKLF